MDFCVFNLWGLGRGLRRILGLGQDRQEQEHGQDATE